MKGNGHSVEELIRLEAYLLSEREGHPHGKERTYWVQAEAIVQGRIAAIAPSGVPKTAKKATAPTAKAKAPAKVPTAAKKAPAPAVVKVEKQLPLMTEVPTVAKPAAKKPMAAPASKAKEAAPKPAATTKAPKAAPKAAPKKK